MKFGVGGKGGVRWSSDNNRGGELSKDDALELIKQLRLQGTEASIELAQKIQSLLALP